MRRGVSNVFVPLLPNHDRVAKAIVEAALKTGKKQPQASPFDLDRVSAARRAAGQLVSGSTPGYRRCREHGELDGPRTGVRFKR